VVTPTGERVPVAAPAATWHRGGVSRLLLASVFAVVALTSCAGGGGKSVDEATAFTWETTLDQGGMGYVLTVDGTVGDDVAAYSLQVEPLVPEDGAGSDDAIAALAGVAVNGLADDGGTATSLGPVDPDGETLVRVRGGERWYRNPWLLGELADVMGDAEWVRVPAGGAVLVDLATSVLNERYDESLRRLLDLVAQDRDVTAPELTGAELDETLTPWIGLAGPAYPIGAAAEVTGDAEEGEVSWRDETTGVDGRPTTMAGTVRWAPSTAGAPEAPEPVVDVAELVAGLGG